MQNTNKTQKGKDTQNVSVLNTAANKTIKLAILSIYIFFCFIIRSNK